MQAIVSTVGIKLNLMELQSLFLNIFPLILALHIEREVVVRGLMLEKVCSMPECMFVIVMLHF